MSGNKVKKNSILIDCTLRDGGYYNRWDFDIDLINRYIHAVSAAGVDFIELGFRSIKNNEYYGPLAYTTDNFIFDLNIPDNIGMLKPTRSTALLSLAAIKFEYIFS